MPASSPVAVGKWRLVWTRQGATANPLQKALAGQVGAHAVPPCRSVACHLIGKQALPCQAQHWLLVCCATACLLPWLAQRKTKPSGIPTSLALHHQPLSSAPGG